MPQYPNFGQEEYVSAAIFNSAFAQVASGISNLASGEVFFIPGVANPTSLGFTFNNSLSVTVTAQNANTNPTTPFKCLFITGQYTDAHGIVNGTDSGVYSVSFASLVPGTGSVTAYIVAQYAQVQESQITITGPPPGHPDYSASFIPYIAYTTLQDTLNIFTTTTAPDNKTTIELARTTLTSGQTSVTSVNTSFQVLASVVPFAVELTGDVTGSASNNAISFLQGKPVSVPSPAANSVLTFNGTDWVASVASGSFPPNGPAGGDLTGSYPNPEVRSSSLPLFTTAGSIQCDGNENVNGNITGGGSLTMTGTLGGAFGTALNQAVMIGQLFGDLSGALTGNWSRYIELPVFDNTGASLLNIIIQFGFYSWIGLTQSQVANQSFTVSLAKAYPTACLWASATINSNNTSGNGAFNQASMIIEYVNSIGSPISQLVLFGDADITSPPSSIKISNGSTNGVTGFTWLSLGY